MCSYVFEKKNSNTNDWKIITGNGNFDYLFATFIDTTIHGYIVTDAIHNVNFPPGVVYRQASTSAEQYALQYKQLHNDYLEHTNHRAIIKTVAQTLVHNVLRDVLNKIPRAGAQRKKKPAARTLAVLNAEFNKRLKSWAMVTS